jgi:hypothetical protein
MQQIEGPVLKFASVQFELCSDTPKSQKCWFQILSEWAVVSRLLAWGRGNKTTTFQRLRFEDLHLFNQAVIWRSKAPTCWFQILSKWAVISHSDWGEASKLQLFKCCPLKTCMCLIKFRNDRPRPQNADSRFSLNEPW